MVGSEGGGGGAPLQNPGPGGSRQPAARKPAARKPAAREPAVPRDAALPGEGPPRSDPHSDARPDPLSAAHPAPPSSRLSRALTLLLVTDPEAGGDRPLEGLVEAGLQGGVTSVQLRDKGAGTGALLPLARRLRALCHAHGALFFVNDRVDLALAAGADGVHVGQDDLPVEAVRRLVPPGFLVGVSAETPALALAARDGGADYLGVGPVWPTASKADAGEAIGVEGVVRVVAATPLPVVAIGGITPEGVPALRGAGAAGVAVIRALLAAPDPEAAARRLRANPSFPTS